MALRPVPEKAESQRLEDARGVTFLGDDGALVAGVRAGNTLAMAALYDRYVGDVRRILLHTLGPRLDLADLVQDVFVIVQRRIADFDGRTSVQAWIFGILVRVASDHRRSFRRKAGRCVSLEHEPSVHAAVTAQYFAVEAQG